jgi:hypothetical protein
MLKIKNAFLKLMTLLSNINRKQPLPLGFEQYLWENMEEYDPKSNEILVVQGDTPEYAYYIIRGYIYVYYEDEDGILHVKRFYRENRIVAFLSFLEQLPSPYYIVAGRDTLLSRISIEHMEVIYGRWQGMKEFAMLVVLQYDEKKAAIKDKLLAIEPEERVRAFYGCFDCLKLASKVRMDKFVAGYLQLRPRTLRKFRKKLGLK